MAGSDANGQQQPAPLARVRLTGAEWLLLVVLAAIQFTHILDFIIVMPLGARYKEQFDLTPQQFALVLSAYGFSAAVAGLFAAAFIDRFDRRSALLFLYAGFTAGTLLCGVATTYPLLLVARVVAGAFGGVVAAVVLAIIGDAFADARRGTATGIVMSAFSVASVVGVPLGLLIAGWFQSCRVPFLVLGVLSLFVLGLAFVVLPPFRGHLGRRSAGRLAGTLGVLVEPTHLRAYALMTALVMSTFTVVPYVAQFLVANVGLREDRELPLVYLFGGAATFLSTPLVGRLSDRFGKLRVFRIMAVLTVVPILLVTNLPHASATAALAVTTLLFITSAGRMVPAVALITASAAPRVRGSFLSINASVQQTAMGLASLVGGAMLSEGAGGEIAGYPEAGLVAACAAAVCLVLAGRLQPAPVDVPLVPVPAEVPV